MTESAKLILPNGKEINLPIRKATIGQDVIDITQLYKESGMFTYDPGFLATASCESKITFIDGDQGVLRHAGYSIEELCRRFRFSPIKTFN